MTPQGQVAAIRFSYIWSENLCCYLPCSLLPELERRRKEEKSREEGKREERSSEVDDVLLGCSKAASKPVPIRLRVKHRHFRQTYTHIPRHLHTHTQPLKAAACQHAKNTVAMKEAQGLLGIQESAYQLSILSSYSFSFSSVFVPLSCSPSLLPYWLLLPFIPIFFSSLHSLLLLLFNISSSVLHFFL